MKINNLNINKVDFSKGDGLVPAIIQDSKNHEVLMLGYMNKVALKKTIDENKVTFYSRSKKRLWTKGEESGNFLYLHSIHLDCDQDTLLILVDPVGPTCHKGSQSCWGDSHEVYSSYSFLKKLELVIDQRYNNNDEASYTSSLFKSGINKVAQKVGEEAVELVIEAKDNNDDLFKGEAADLIYHLLVLLRAKSITLNEVLDVLKSRH